MVTETVSHQQSACGLQQKKEGSKNDDMFFIFDVLLIINLCKCAQVTSINPRFAKVHILYVGSTPLKDRFRGTIRREDVRATEKDKVETYKSFRPGDIVLAKVISLGDVQSNYLLTTAENELGVVVAHSEAGAQMVPISWCEMQCPRTHAKEFRKVARVQPEYLQA